MAMDARTLLDRLESAVSGSGAGAVAAAAADIDAAVFDAAEFPGPLFDGLLDLLGSPALRQHRDALIVVKLFDDLVGLLRPDQAARLVDGLVTLVPALHDDVAAFLAVETLVVTAKPERFAFERIGELAPQCGPSRLQAVVHGYDWLCKRATGSAVRDDCLAQLRHWQRHPDATVAAEAGAALRRRMPSVA